MADEGKEPYREENHLKRFTDDLKKTADYARKINWKSIREFDKKEPYGIYAAASLSLWFIGLYGFGGIQTHNSSDLVQSILDNWPRIFIPPIPLSVKIIYNLARYKDIDGEACLKKDEKDKK